MFMGEEYGETNPFLFFTDFHGDLAKAVREGRAKEFTGHAGHDEEVPDPNDEQTFTRSKLDWNKLETPEGQAWLAFTRELLALRQQHIVPLLADAGGHSGKVLATAEGFIAVSWHFPQGELSLALNIGKHHQPLPDMLGRTIFAWPQETEALSQHAIVVRLDQGATK
jgi:1,4-alpha-glucan branching enzyme